MQIICLLNAVHVLIPHVTLKEDGYIVQAYNKYGKLDIIINLCF